MSRTFTPDQELIDRLLLNDTIAFEELYCRYWYSLYTYSVKKLQSSDDARQIVKNIFIDLWETRHSIPSSLSVSQHLYTAVRRTVVERLNEKLENADYSELIEEQIAASFTAEALQDARKPVQIKQSAPTASELIRQNTISREQPRNHVLNMASMKWLSRMVAAKLD
jgi:DNA-directed RNA polymerase specialized sigma24 family protein